jgi:O-antigen/teichoic acid export membrane protein
VKSTKSLKSRLPAGIVDASFASLATFAIGLAAVNLLEDAERGVYAVFFTTFLMGTVLARNLVLTPAEVEAVAFPLEERIPLIARTLTLGLGPAFIGAAAALLAALVAAPLTEASVIVPFTLTTAVASILSPLQDHVRRMLHIGSKSWLAASVSIVQFVTTVTGILVMTWRDVDLPWIPFGSLAIANLVSLSFGWLLTRRSHQRSTGRDQLRFVDLARRGRWLVLQAAAPSVAGFVAAAIITRLASPEALGFAEAARVVSQPILVLATGLGAVLNPRAVEAAMNRGTALARQTNRIYLLVTASAGASYLAIAGWDWALNPMPHIVPSAYEVGGLVALSIVANLATASVFLQFNELMGAKREKTLTTISWAISPIMLIASLTAGVTDAFARPIGRLGQGLARFTLQRRVLKAHYAGADQPGDADGPIG